jgi:hypothetical protein
VRITQAIVGVFCFDSSTSAREERIGKTERQANGEPRINIAWTALDL